MLTDAADGRRRVVHGLIFTAVYSRHMFVWPTYRQTLADVIAGFEAAWEFFGGVFAVVIPDNMKAIVDRADAIDPELNDAFREYAQSRGFAIDPTRVRSPRDKPRVERMCDRMCGRISLPEKMFRDLDDCRVRAEHWCAAGGRDADPWHYAAAASRGIHRRRAPAPQAGARDGVRHPVLDAPEGGTGSACADRSSALQRAR